MSINTKEKHTQGVCVEGHYSCKVYIDVFQTSLLLLCPHCGKAMKFKES